MNLDDNCACCGMSRRDFLKLSALFTSSFGAAIAADSGNLPVHANANDQPVKIGYRKFGLKPRPLRTALS